MPEIADPERLGHFFERAARVLRGAADRHVRIAIYGDSNHTMDFISGRMRRVLQGKYGDAGHGYTAVGRPWSHYRHMDEVHGLTEDRFESFAVTTHPLMDHRYGLAGICAASTQSGARAWVATAGEDAPIGRSASRFELFYLREPRGGTFELLVDGSERERIDAAGDAPALGHTVLDLPDGPHRVEMIARGKRSVRFLGTVLERGGASFIVDSFGVGALNTRAHAAEDPALNAEMLALRGYDLVIFATGANDVFTLDVTPKHLVGLIQLQRSALPEVSVLVVTPPDRGKETTFPPTIAAIEQRIALAADNGAALWNLYEAMGKSGSMRRMKERKLAFADYTHFTREGGAWVGDRLTFALWRALARYAEAHPELGCEERGGSPALAR